MNRVNENDLPWGEYRSPKGTYHTVHRNFASALAAPEAGPSLPGDAPFEVMLVRVPAGAVNWPFHSHSAQWECYLILSGTGTLRHGEQRAPLAPGDCVLCPPDDPHQIINDGENDLLYYVIANNWPADMRHYPDSDKWAIAVPGRRGTIFRKTEVPYLDREE